MLVWMKILYSIDTRSWSYSTYDLCSHLFSQCGYCFASRSADPSTHEVAAALIILKNRHKLSNRCLDHMCKLMHLLKAINVPKSSAHIKRILLSESTTDFTASSYFCSECNEMSASDTNCSRITTVETKEDFVKRHQFFFVCLYNLKSKIFYCVFHHCDFNNNRIQH